MTLPVTLVGLAVGLVYEVGFLVWRGATPGKMLLGTRVRPAAGPGPVSVAVALRRQVIHVVTTLSALNALLGIFAFALYVLDPAWLLRDPRRQALHDKVADTVVVLAPRRGRVARAATGRGRTVPVHSPNPMTVPSGPGAVARRTPCRRPRGTSARAVGEGQRLLAAPAELEEAAAGVLAGAGDRARPEEVAGAHRRAVDGEVGEHLGRRPVHVAELRARDDGAVPLDLDVDVEAVGVRAVAVADPRR